MKKIILSAFLLTALLGNISISAQDKIELQKNDHLTNSKTNLHNGIPDIGLPLFNLSALSNVNIGVALSYSTEGVSTYKMISDVGKGWSLQYGGRIYKSNTKSEDDYKTVTGSSEISSEVYFYNFSGHSGRFYIGKDETSNELTAVQLQPSKSKISITKDSTKPNKILSFTIIDENGNSYLFDKINIDKFRRTTGGINGFPDDSPFNTKVTNSSFSLSKISNNKNQEVATFEYNVDTEIMDQIGTLQDHKIKQININNYGSIVFVYKPGYGIRSLKDKGNIDWYQADKLVLKDKNNNIINQYSFLKYDVFLNGLQSLDAAGKVIQQYTFDYKKIDGNLASDSFGYGNVYDQCNLDTGVMVRPNTTNPQSVSANSLKSITLPTGGRIEYEFESNSIEETDPIHNDDCQDNGCTGYYDLDKIYTLDFDMKEGSLTPDLNFNGNYLGRLFVKYTYDMYPYPPPKPGVPNDIEYSLIGEDGHLVTPEPYKNYSDAFPCANIQTFIYAPSQVKKIFFSGARQGYGKVDFYAIKSTRNHKNKLGYGLRIKSIKNFDAGSDIPSKWVEYEYNKFSDPLTSSGEIVDEDLSNGDKELSKSVGYCNIKTINKMENTYSKYIFHNYTEISNLVGFSYSFMDFGAYLKRAGLLKHKEVYGTSNNLLQESNYNYEPENIAVKNVKHQGQPITKIFIKKEIQTSQNYVNGSNQALVNHIESTYENQFNNLVYSKETLYDGTIVEKNIQYAKEKNIQKLLNANMIATPLSVEIKNDGKIVGKTETKLDDPTTLYPTSILTFNNQNQNTFKKITFDNYDEKGNLRETKTENGIPVTTIWGYHQTLPIIKITGGTYAEASNLSSIIAAITASDADDNNSSNEPVLIQALDNVRKDAVLKNYQIETYTYDPLIGTTSKTGSNGLKESYMYDSSRRILKVLDKDGKVINTYDYHYSPPMYANDRFEKEYTNQSCTIGNFPNKYKYIIPAYAYFSYVSKDDANQKAYQDLIANGQNIANQNAGCTLMACTVTKGYHIATLNSASLTMQDSSTLRLQMNFPYDSSLTWALGKAVGKINGNCISKIWRRNFTYGNWKITIYPNGNIYAQLTTGSSSIPNGTIVNFDVTFPINY